MPDEASATLARVAGVVRLELAVDAELATVVGSCEPLADGAELPLCAATVQLPEHHESLIGELVAKVVAGELFAGLFVIDADEGVTYRSEDLSALLGSPNDDREDDALDVIGDLVEEHLDSLVVALAATSAVVSCEDDAPVRGVAVVGVDEPLLILAVARVLLIRHDTRRVEGCSAYVEVVVRPTGFVDIPAAGDNHPLERRAPLSQGDVTALFECHSHVMHHFRRVASTNIWLTQSRGIEWV